MVGAYKPCAEFIKLARTIKLDAVFVNIAFVEELHPGVDTGLIALLKDRARTELSVASDRVRELKERLGI